MKQFILFMAVAAFLATISSCSTTTHSSTAKTRYLSESSIRESTTMADLKVEEQKVTGSSTGNNISEETAKNLAVYDALKKVNADVLVEPSYDISRTGNSISVTVYGFPGFYKNFRKPTGQDSLIMGWKGNGETFVAPNSNRENNSVILSNQGGRNVVATPYSAMQVRPYTRTAMSSGPYDADAYNSEKKKGNRLAGWGLTLFFAGIIVDACSPLDGALGNDPNGIGFPIMLGVGSAAMIAGAIMMPVGIAHLIRAKHIKNQGVAQNIDISVFPGLNVASNRYEATLAFKF